LNNFGDHEERGTDIKNSRGKCAKGSGSKAQDQHHGKKIGPGGKNYASLPGNERRPSLTKKREQGTQKRGEKKTAVFVWRGGGGSTNGKSVLEERA